MHKTLLELLRMFLIRAPEQYQNISIVEKSSYSVADSGFPWPERSANTKKSALTYFGQFFPKLHEIQKELDLDWGAKEHEIYTGAFDNHLFLD